MKADYFRGYSEGKQVMNTYWNTTVNHFLNYYEQQELEEEDELERAKYHAIWQAIKEFKDEGNTL